MKALARSVGRLDYGVSVAKARALAELTDAELEARIKARLKEIEPALVDQWEGRPSD